MPDTITDEQIAEAIEPLKELTAQVLRNALIELYSKS